MARGHCEVTLPMVCTEIYIAWCSTPTYAALQFYSLYLTISAPLSTDKTQGNLKQGLRGNSNYILSYFVQLGTRQW